MRSTEPDEDNPLWLFAPEPRVRTARPAGSGFGDVLPPLLSFDEERREPVSDVPSAGSGAHRDSRPAADRDRHGAASNPETPIRESLWAEIRCRIAAVAARMAGDPHGAVQDAPMRRAGSGAATVHASVQLDQTATAFKSLKHSIALALSEATYLTELVTALEKRTAKLTEHDPSLRHAHGTVWRLEQRAIKTTVQLRHVIRTTIDLERELAHHRDAAEDASRDVREPAALRRAQRGLPTVRASVTGVLIALAVGSAMIAAPSHDAGETPVGAAASTNAKRAGLPVLSSHAWTAEFGAVRVPVLQPAITTDHVAAAASDPNRRVLTNVTTGRPAAVDAVPLMQTEIFTGDLTIESHPGGAVVLLDRQPVGVTPLSLRNVRIGSHVVWIERNGYRRWTGVVTVAAATLVRASADLQSER